MAKRVKGAVFLIIAAAAVLLIRSLILGFHTRDTTRRENIRYAVVEESEIPKSLLGQIEERKKEHFHLTWESGGNLYLVEGYGQKPTEGYRIIVRDCYASSDTIYLNTELSGPVKGEPVEEILSYPFIVVKLKSAEKNVIFM